MTSPWGWTLVVLAMVPVIALLVWALADLLRRTDIAGPRRAVWIAAVVVIPLVGPLLYLIFRPTRRADIRGFGGGGRRRKP